MNKLAKVLAGFAALAFVVTPAVPAGAYSEGVAPSDGAITVSTEADLREALADSNVTAIKLGDDIENIASPIVISRPITLDGDDHTITVGVGDSCKNQFSKHGCQVVQVYNQPAATTTIQNITLRGGLAGIQNNGSNVTLKGSITFENNEWGGMEMTKGDGVITVPTTNFSDANITNANETAGQPTLWTDGLTAEEVNITFGQAQAAIYKDNDGESQVQFFLSETNAQKALENTDVYSELADSPMANATVEVNSGNPTEEPTDPETPDVTKPVDEGEDTEADVTAPNTGATTANIALVVTGAVVAILTAVYATRFASARK